VRPCLLPYAPLQREPWGPTSVPSSEKKDINSPTVQRGPFSGCNELRNLRDRMMDWWTSWTVLLSTCKLLITDFALCSCNSKKARWPNCPQYTELNLSEDAYLPATRADRSEPLQSTRKNGRGQIGCVPSHTQKPHVILEEKKHPSRHSDRGIEVLQQSRKTSMLLNQHKLLQSSSDLFARGRITAAGLPLPSSPPVVSANVQRLWWK
jgi:hypothetical protein